MSKQSVRVLVASVLLAGTSLVAAAACEGLRPPDIGGEADAATSEDGGVPPASSDGAADDVRAPTADGAVRDSGFDGADARDGASESVVAVYAGSCVTPLSNREPTRAIRFFTETTFDPSSRSITMTLSPLVGWDTANDAAVAPAQVSRTAIRGTAFRVENVPVDSSGGFTANFGNALFVAAANSIDGRAFDIQAMQLDVSGFGSDDPFCSTVRGTMTTPTAFEFEASENTCLFERVDEGAAFPAFTPAAFVCPPR